MYCTACGKENPRDAKFCAYCGKSITSSSNLEQKDDDTSWEFCQIQSSQKTTNTFSVKCECFFYADAIGKNGKYCAAKTDKYILQQKWNWEPPINPPFGNKSKDQEKSAQLLSGLVKTLQNDGWELMSERGPFAWSYKFRRKEKVNK